jgi:hypothetical protein
MLKTHLHGASEMYCGICGLISRPSSSLAAGAVPALRAASRSFCFLYSSRLSFAPIKSKYNIQIRMCEFIVHGRIAHVVVGMLVVLSSCPSYLPPCGCWWIPWRWCCRQLTHDVLWCSLVVFVGVMLELGGEERMRLQRSLVSVT